LREITKLKEAVEARGKLTETEKIRRIEELEKQVISLQQTNLKLKENVDSMTKQIKKTPSQANVSRSKSPRPSPNKDNVSETPGANPTTQ